LPSKPKNRVKGPKRVPKRQKDGNALLEKNSAHKPIQTKLSTKYRKVALNRPKVGERTTPKPEKVQKGMM
jgi:hypothetical protein